MSDIARDVRLTPNRGRTVDMVVAMACAFLFAPLLLIIALWVLLESQGPVTIRRAVALRGGQVVYATEFRLWRMDSTPAGARPRPRPNTVIGSLLSMTSAGRLPRMLDVWAGRLSLGDALFV